MHGLRFAIALTAAAGLFAEVEAAYADGYAIPLEEALWSNLAYRKIPPNEILFDEEKLIVRVRASASPLIFRLPNPRRVNGVDVQARWTGSLNLAPETGQGDKGNDDFVLKIGLVESGDKTLGWIQRRMAADWIKQLHDMAPQGYGIERIHFLSTTQEPNGLGKARQHPLSELLYETRVTHLSQSGPFEMRHRLAEPTEVLGVWLSIDGDDTGSQFEVEIDSITLIDVENGSL